MKKILCLITAMLIVNVSMAQEQEWGTTFSQKNQYSKTITLTSPKSLETLIAEASGISKFELANADDATLYQLAVKYKIIQPLESSKTTNKSMAKTKKNSKNN